MYICMYVCEQNSLRLKEADATQRIKTGNNTFEEEITFIVITLYSSPHVYL